MFVTLHTQVGESVAAEETDVLLVAEDLDGLAQPDPGLARVVGLHCFAGLSEEEIAQALDLAAQMRQPV